MSNEGARLAVEEIHQYYFEKLRWTTGRDMEQVAAIITKHCPSGDVPKLREALKPFARMADKFDIEPYSKYYPDRTLLKEHSTVLSHCYLTLGDCRNAKSALASVPAEPQVVRGALLPCPFCGGAVVRDCVNDSHHSDIACNACGESFRMSDEVWNTRACSRQIDKELEKQIAELVLHEVPELEKEGAENIWGYLVHWDEIIKACNQAWPEPHGYSQSPLELIAEIINERDALKANPPQVDATLEQLAHELRKQITLPIRSVVDNSLLESIASTLLAHAKPQPKEGVIEVSGLTPKLREVLAASVKWLDRISERRAELPASFLDNCNPEPLAKQIRELLKARKSQPKDGDRWERRHAAVTRVNRELLQTIADIGSVSLTEAHRMELATYVADYFKRGVHGVWFNLAEAIAAMLKRNKELEPNTDDCMKVLLSDARHEELLRKEKIADRAAESAAPGMEKELADMLRVFANSHRKIHTAMDVTAAKELLARFDQRKEGGK